MYVTLEEVIVETNEIPHKLYAAYQQAMKSTDQNTKIGTVICDQGWNILYGCNRHVAGTEHDAKYHERPYKYYVTEHAERWPILQAAKHGIALKGLTMIGTAVACPDCARAIALSGLSYVICHKECMDHIPDRWRDLVDEGWKIMEGEGVQLEMWSGKLGGPEGVLGVPEFENLYNGEIWYP
jgi:deoxycytidylate deaminase